MARNKRRKLLPIARSLFAQGFSPSEIGEALDVSARTVRRWRESDEQDWAEARESRSGQGANEIMRELRGLLTRVINDKDLGPVEKADAVAKLDRALSNIQQRVESIDLHMKVCEDMARWARDNLDEGDLKTAKELIAGYTRELREDTR